MATKAIKKAEVKTAVKMESVIDTTKVTLKPIKKHGWLPDDHDGSLRYSKCFERLTVQATKGTGVLMTGLTEEDEKRLEKKMHMSPGTLSKYNKDYWTMFKIDVPSEGISLDTNNPEEEVKYLVLKAHQRVANSEMERFDTPFAEYVMTSVEQEAKMENKKSKLKRKAYKVFSNMSTTEMADVLKVMGKRAGDAASVDFIKEYSNKKEPFCLSVSFKAPHNPVSPDPQYDHVYKGKTFTKNPNFGQEGAKHLPKQSKLGRQYPRLVEHWNAENYDYAMSRYYQLIHGIDVAVGMILAESAKQGEAHNTVI